MTDISKKIEAILFFKGEEMKIKTLASFCGVSEREVAEALDELQGTLSSSGLMLVRTKDAVSMAVGGEFASLMDEIRKEEMSTELSRSALETLALIVYKGRALRREIDYIRGVNSSFILRQLLIRGLVEKNSDERDGRMYVYKPTIELLALLGVSQSSDLPKYEEIKTKLEETSDGQKDAGSPIENQNGGQDNN